MELGPAPIASACYTSQVVNGPSASHFMCVLLGASMVKGASSFHISYRNARDSLFHLNEHTEYLKCILKCQEIKNISQSLDNCHCQEQHRFHSRGSCSSFTVA